MSNNILKITKPKTRSRSDRLAELKVSILKELQAISTAGDEEDNNKSIMDFQQLERELATTIDNFTSQNIKLGLETTFGNCGFRVSMKSLFKPSLGPKSEQNRNYISHIRWTMGPNSHQVHFYLVENFGSYIESTEFNRTLYSRIYPNIEKKHATYYFPVAINDTEFKPIDCQLSKVTNKVNDQVTLTYFIVDARDKELGIYNVRGETLEETFTRFQERIEEVYYMANYDKQKIRLRDKYERTRDIHEQEVPVNDVEGVSP